MRYEYRVVPAPGRGGKLPGVRGAEARFAAAIEKTINDLAMDGWEYLRSDTLPSEERAGLTQTQTVWRNLLVFRRENAALPEAYAPRMLESPDMADHSAPEPPVDAVSAQTSRDAPLNPSPPPAPDDRRAFSDADDTDDTDADEAILSFEEEDSGNPEASATPQPPSAANKTDGDADNGVENASSVTTLPGPLMARAARLRAGGD